MCVSSIMSVSSSKPTTPFQFNSLYFPCDYEVRLWVNMASEFESAYYIVFLQQYCCSMLTCLTDRQNGFGHDGPKVCQRKHACPCKTENVNNTSHCGRRLISKQLIDDKTNPKVGHYGSLADLHWRLSWMKIRCVFCLQNGKPSTQARSSYNNTSLSCVEYAYY